MRFYKYHALGNDYLVYYEEEHLPALSASANEWLTPDVIRRICDRHYGLGADGILVGKADATGSGFTLRIFNPDGSEAGKSGNGLRIYARCLWDRKLVSEMPFPISTPGGTVCARILEQGREVEVEMGRVSFDSRLIPVAGPVREVIRESIDADRKSFLFCAATIGNPHCVVLQKATPVQAKKWGPLIERHRLFPERTNVQFLEVLTRERIRIEIWERGAGYTLASGSSSSAAAAVAKRLGECDREITVEMPGGEISISIDNEYAATMRGAVTRIGEMCAHQELLQDLQ